MVHSALGRVNTAYTDVSRRRMGMTTWRASAPDSPLSLSSSSLALYEPARNGEIQRIMGRYAEPRPRKGVLQRAHPTAVAVVRG